MAGSARVLDRQLRRVGTAVHSPVRQARRFAVSADADLRRRVASNADRPVWRPADL